MRLMLKLCAPLTLLIVLAGCRAKGPALPHERLDADASVLRTAFNADAGKVRVVMLVSPT